MGEIENKEGGESQEREKPGFLAGIFSNSKVREATELAETRLAVTKLKSECDELTEALAQSAEQNAKLSAQIAELSGLAGQLQAEKAELEALNPKKESVQAAAARVAAENHVDAAELPASGSAEESNHPKTQAELEAALKECATHAERSNLVKQFRSRGLN